MLFLILYAGYFVHFYPVLSVSGCVKKCVLIYVPGITWNLI